MIYDKKKGGGRNLVTSPFALLHFYIAREEFRGIGLTQQLHTSGLAIYSSFFFLVQWVSAEKKGEIRKKFKYNKAGGE